MGHHWRRPLQREEATQIPDSSPQLCPWAAQLTSDIDVQDQITIGDATLKSQTQPVQVFLLLPEKPVPDGAFILLCLQVHNVWPQKILYLSHTQPLSKHRVAIRVSRPPEGWRIYSE